MNWHIILFISVMTTRLFTSVSSGYKHVVVHVPYRVKVIHHKRTMMKQGDDNDYVIGHSGGINLDNTQFSLSGKNSNFLNTIGGGHGQSWLRTGKSTEGMIGGISGEPNFGTNLKELNSYPSDLGDGQTSLMDQYFAGQDGFDADFKRK